MFSTLRTSGGSSGRGQGTVARGSRRVQVTLVLSVALPVDLPIAC